MSSAELPMTTNLCLLVLQPEADLHCLKFPLTGHEDVDQKLENDCNIIAEQAATVLLLFAVESEDD